MGKLDIQNLELSYKQKSTEHHPFRLSVPELHINEGEFFTLLGESGCGKTTLLKTIAGLEAPEGGNILMDGQSVIHIPTEKRGIGMVFQSSLLFPHMNVLKNVCFGLKMAKIPQETAIEWAREALSSVGLEGYENRSPLELSGGQQQRVSMARSIVTRPKVLLMDEPFSSLDSSLRDEMRKLIRRLHQKYKITIVFVTHDIDEAFQISDRIALMDQGKIIQIGTPKELYYDPKSIDVAKFMGPVNRVMGSLENSIFKSQEWLIQMPSQEDAIHKTLIIRPEDISLHNEPCNDSLNNCFSARIVSLDERRGYNHYVVDVQGVLLNVVERTVENSSLRNGDTCYVVIEKRRMLLMSGDVENHA